MSGDLRERPESSCPPRGDARSRRAARTREYQRRPGTEGGGRVALRLTLWCGSTHRPLRRVRETVGRITSHSPISLLTNRAVPRPVSSKLRTVITSGDQRTSESRIKPIASGIVTSALTSLGVGWVLGSSGKCGVNLQKLDRGQSRRGQSSGNSGPLARGSDSCVKERSTHKRRDLNIREPAG